MQSPQEHLRDSNPFSLSRSPTPLESARSDGFTSDDERFITHALGIEQIVSPSRLWSTQHPANASQTNVIDALDERHIRIEPGSFIRGAFELPDGTQRIIWEHVVYDNDSVAELTPAAALTDALAGDYQQLTAIETPPHTPTAND